MRFSDLIMTIKKHPLGLIIVLLILALSSIIWGLFSCLIKILERLPSNLQTPKKILEGNICSPNKIFQVRFGEGIINLFKHTWFVYLVLIIGFIIFICFGLKKRK